MPTVDLEYSKIKDILDDKPTSITTPFGHAVVEIQGVLNLPSGTIDAEYMPFNGRDAIKYGKLSFDGNKATLIIGNSQRLVGSVVDLDVPLGVMKMGDGSVELVDVIKKKVVFKQRPLPIM